MGWNYRYTSSGIGSHAEGIGTQATQNGAHAEGDGTTASGNYSHAEGLGTVADASSMHTQGRYNVSNTAYADWVSGTSYVEGDKVVLNQVGYICIEDNADTTWTSSKWQELESTGDYAFVIGNGQSSNSRSNAMAVKWTGDLHIAGDIYVGCNNDSTGGTKLVVSSVEFATDLEVQSIISNWGESA